MSVTFVNLGRKRGEFERATKKLVQAHNGVKHPRDLGFIAQPDLADRACAAMVKCNGMVKEGRLLQGVPDEKWTRSVLENPLRTLAPQKLWIFLPERRELQIREGHVLPILDKTLIPFCHPELFADLGNGYRVVIHFDPSEPTLGCAVLNNEAQDSTKNVESWALGEVLGIADYAEFAPQFSAADGFDPSIDRRKRFNAWNATAYRGTGLFGRRAGKVDEARDGTGNVVRRETGQRAEAPATTPQTPGRLAAAPVQGATRHAVNRAQDDPQLQEFLDEDNLVPA